jgi:ribosomal protein L29
MTKIERSRVKTDDQLKDESSSKLKKEQFNLRFQRGDGQLEKPRASAKSAATSPVSRRSQAQRSR